jgi:hypothetical protein
MIMRTLSQVRPSSYDLIYNTYREYLPVINVMKRDIVVIHADGMLVPHLEEILQSTDYRGFPVVKSQTDATVLGFMRKTELRFSLGKHSLGFFASLSDVGRGCR